MKVLVIAAFLLLPNFSVGQTSVSPESVTRKEIITVVNQWADSFRNKDAHLNASVYAPVITTFYERHNIRRSEHEQEMLPVFAAIEQVKNFEVSNIDVSLDSSQANATVELIILWDTTVDKKTNAGGRPVRLVLGKTAAGWLISEEVDGKDWPTAKKMAAEREQQALAARRNRAFESFQSSINRIGLRLGQSQATSKSLLQRNGFAMPWTCKGWSSPGPYPGTGAWYSTCTTSRGKENVSAVFQIYSRNRRINPDTQLSTIVQTSTDQLFSLLYKRVGSGCSLTLEYDYMLKINRTLSDECDKEDMAMK